MALNGDILTDLDLTAMVELHRDRGAVATIALTPVEDARPYGLVPTEDDGRVLEFREKPVDLVPGDINAGTYVLTPAALGGVGAGAQRLDRTGDLPGPDRTGRLPVYGVRVRPRTGWTSGPPRTTSRRTSTSSTVA